MAGVGNAFGIGNEAFRFVMRFSTLDRIVELPEIEEAGRIVNRLPRFGTAAFVGTIVHDRDARVKGVDDCGRVRKIQAVVSGEIQIDGADEILGANELQFFLLGEITEIDETKFAKGEERAERARVL